VVLGAISLDLFAVLFGGAVALLPVYARTSCMSHGRVRLPAQRRRRRGRHDGIAAHAPPVAPKGGPHPVHRRRHLGIGTVVFGLSRNYYLSLIALAVLGCADMISVYVRSNVVPLATPNTMLGRVAAVEMVFIGASNELGAFESGTVAWLIGPVLTVVLGGLARSPSPASGSSCSRRSTASTGSTSACRTDSQPPESLYPCR